jgi:hypothetical protein
MKINFRSFLMVSCGMDLVSLLFKFMVSHFSSHGIWSVHGSHEEAKRFNKTPNFPPVTGHAHLIYSSIIIFMIQVDFKFWTFSFLGSWKFGVDMFQLPTSFVTINRPKNFADTFLFSFFSLRYNKKSDEITRIIKN